MSEKIVAGNLDEVISKNAEIRDEMREKAVLIRTNLNRMQISSSNRLAMQILKPYGLIQMPIDNPFWSGAIFVKNGKKIPVIVSRADGGFYISETTTAQRKKDGKSYVAIADHVYNSYGFMQYTKGDRYDSLEDAYKAYSKLFEDGKYPDYKDTLPQ